MTVAAIIAAILQGGPLVAEFWFKIHSLVNLGRMKSKTLPTP